MSRASLAVVIPVLDGARWLTELLDALAAQDIDDILVIDSGSGDGSRELVRARAEANVRLREIARAEFGHGRTRNLGVAETDGELVAFLTQDATPQPGWADAYRRAFAADPELGAAFGPHRPRPDTSPMIARELTEFFAGAGPQGFLSNVNACYRRAALIETPFPDVAYAEDQAFARNTGRRIAYVPAAAVLHAHDYPPVSFMRRYFDEYRGLRQATGHVEQLRVRGLRQQVRADAAFARSQGRSPLEWGARSALHHGGRRVFAALGSRADRLPPPVERALSLERSGRTRRNGASPDAANGETIAPGTAKQPSHQPARGSLPWQTVLDVAREGSVPLLDPVPGMSERERLHIAAVIPYFRRGSGGHSTIYNLLTRLEERGHTVSTWIHDPLDVLRDDWPAVVRGNLREFFRPTSGPVFKGFADWHGADIALATGWETVHPVLRLDHVRARAYLVQDHEPEFFPTSAQRLWAQETYQHDLHVIGASRWLASLLAAESTRPTNSFDLGVDHAAYQARPVERRTDTVVFYARDVTPRRGVPLGLLALAELHRRRPNLRFVLFGDDAPAWTPFPYGHLGIASPEQLSWAYSSATVGLSLSLTNYSLIPQEMMACGLPCVELAGRSLEASLGGADVARSLVELAEPDPIALADAVERLLDDPRLRAQRAAAGIEFVARRTWEHAADQLEAGLRAALRYEESGGAEAAELREIPAPQRAAAGASARAVPTDPHEGAAVTRRLFERVTDDDVAAVYAAADQQQRDYLGGVAGDDLSRLLLVLGTWHGIPGLLERTGLRPDQPPEEVHAMARGFLAAGGDLGMADLIEHTARAAGVGFDQVTRALDLGCSSGRVVRALAAAYPEIEWHGCDPNGPAIEWASAHLPGVTFTHQATDPPSPYGDGSFDLVYAISIWSHHGEGPARRWLDEMHRLIRPGGVLIITTHGLQSVAYYASTGERSANQLAEIRRTLYRRGFWFAPEFGDRGDWGVHHPQWGTAFFTTDWLLCTVRGRWLLADQRIGQNLGNQDVYALIRR